MGLGSAGARGKTMVMIGAAIGALPALALLFLLFQWLTNPWEPTFGDMLWYAVIIVLLLVAAFIVRNGMRLIARHAQIRQYVDLIVNKGRLSIDDIAGVVRKSTDTVLDDLAEMQKAGMLARYTVDPRTRALTRVAVSGPAGTEVSIVTFECQGCGAKNSAPALAGQRIECEHCTRPYEPSN